MIPRYWRLLRPFHHTFMWFVALLVLYEGLQLIDGYVISIIVRLFGEGASQNLWLLFFGVLIVFDECFMRIDNAVDWHIITRHSHPIYKYLKLESIGKFLALDIGWHRRHNSGALVGKVNDGTRKVLEILDALSWEFVPATIQTVLSLLPLFFLSIQTALATMVAFAVFAWITIRGIRQTQVYRRVRYDKHELEWHKGVEMVQAVETNLMFGQQRRVQEEQEALLDEIRHLGTQEALLGVYKINRWRIRVLTVARRLILGFWVLQLYQGTIDIANLIFVYGLTERLFHSFWRFARLLDRAAEASEGALRLANLMEETGTVHTGTLVPKITGSVDIQMKNVCFAYEAEYTKEEGILPNLTLSIPGGSIVALVGESGAGKTTIRKIATALLPIQSGSITVGGVDVKDWDQKSLLSLFSYVPQGDDVDIFSCSIRENIAYPKPQACLDEIVRAAKLADIHTFIMSLEHGYDTQVGERGKRLSGGQKQRLALARAILADRPILILDEATSAIDVMTERAIQEQMRTILTGKTAIIIAHRLSTVWDIADKIVVLRDGRKVEEGTHEELMKLGGLYAKMVALQTTE